MDTAPELVRKVVGDIAGICTSVVAISYSNRLVLFINQQNKLGTVVSCRKERPLENSHEPLVDLNILLGRRDDELLLVICRELSHRIFGSSEVEKPLLLFMNLIPSFEVGMEGIESLWTVVKSAIVHDQSIVT